MANPEPVSLGVSDDELTWRDAALRVGEELRSVGPDGYYAMTQVEWRDWAVSAVRAVLSHGEAALKEQNNERMEAGRDQAGVGAGMALHAAASSRDNAALSRDSHKESLMRPTLYTRHPDGFRQVDNPSVFIPVLPQVEAPHQAAGTGGSIEALRQCREAVSMAYRWLESPATGSDEQMWAYEVIESCRLALEAAAALLTRRDQQEPPAPREWRDALADLVDVCYAEGSSPSWRVCQVCGIEHRPDEAMSGDRPHRKDCIVDVAEKLLTAWTKSQSVSLATQRDAPQEQNEEDLTRVGPSVPCVEPTGSTASKPPGAVTAAERSDQEAGPQAWKAAFYRLGRVLNIEAREHGELIEALGMGYDITTMEDDEQFHARALARIAELKQAEQLGRDADPAKEPEYIWCDNCEAVRPCVRDYMPAGGPNQHAATDLLCGECRLIIATLHHVAAPPVAAKEPETE